MNSTLMENSLFNYHEIWGITIAFIYFLIGFPSNLLSIVVCYKSIFHKTFAKMAQKNKLKLINKELKTSMICSKPMSINNFTKENIFYEEKFSENVVFSDSYTKMSLKKDRKCSLRPIKSNECLTRNQSVLTLSERQNFRVMPVRNSAKNPHCKNFELFLIEISFCDIIIITYNFIEWTLLILSRVKVIDTIYAEPILISKFMCRFIIALNRTVILIHNWLVAFMAITRCYAIYKPLNSNTNFSSKFYFKLNLSVLLSLILIFTTFNIYGVSFLSYTKILGGNLTIFTGKLQNYHYECKVSQEVYVKYKYFDAYLNLTLGIIGYSLPCIITLLINLVLIYNIRNLNSCYKSTHVVRRNSKEIGTNSHLITSLSKNQFFKATSSLLTLSFSYLICNIPYSVLYLLMSLNLVRMNGDVIFAVMCLRYLNHILNFYIYFATGKRFRDDVVKLLKFRR